MRPDHLCPAAESIGHHRGDKVQRFEVKHRDNDLLRHQEVCFKINDTFLGKEREDINAQLFPCVARNQLGEFRLKPPIWGVIPW